MKKPDIRKPEEVKVKNIEKFESGKQKVTTISTQIKQSDTYNIGATKTKEHGLLGFQNKDADYEESDRRRGGYKGGERQKKANLMNQKDFPTL